MKPHGHKPTDNPFSTRRVQPGAIAFRFRENESAEALVNRLARNKWRGEIIGPHGSGKSSLLAALAPCIEARGMHVLSCALHDGQRRLPHGWLPDGPLAARTLLVVDGYEQLGYLNRFKLRRRCRQLACGLLVTAHRSVGLPKLYETSTSGKLALDIVAELLKNDAIHRITDQEVASQFRLRKGNLREVLFDLYDLYENRRD